MQRVVASLFALALSSCDALRPTVPRLPFPEAEYAALPKQGTGTVRGQAFFKTRGGTVITAAGSKVTISPSTTYTMQWWVEVYERGKKLAPADARLGAYERTTVADADGRFTFNKVPRGLYFVATNVVWESSPYEFQGGILAKAVDVVDDKVIDIILTR